ncbi:tetracycline-efflux transporter-like protein [Cryomyces antarcticus]|nr:hypothetical protein LTR39_001815 [Cryomyces antarcticus]
MENDGIFAAEADLDHRANSRKQGGASHAGQDSTVAAEGGLVEEGSRRNIGSEDTARNDGEATESDPLLPGGGKGSGSSWTGMAEFEGEPWWKTPSIYWMLPPFFLFTLAFGGIVVPKLNLILTLICREYLSDRQATEPGFTMMPIVFGEDNPQCRIPEVQSRVAQFTLYGNLIAGLLSAVASPKLGALSDRYGRKRIIILTTMGMLCGEIITIVAASKPETFPVNWILVGFALDGLCGSFIAAMALANAYATDCTAPTKRSVAFGYFHGCLFTGIALGPILSGYVIKASGTVLSVFYIALGFHLFFILFVTFVIPESLTKTRQSVAREKYHKELEELGPAADWINQIRSFNLLAPLKILWPTGEGSSPAVRHNLVLLAAVDTIMFGVAMGSVTVVIIYANYQFGWGNFESSIFVSIVNTCRVLCLVVILPIVTRLVRGPNASSRMRDSGCDNFDLYVIRTAVFFDMLGYLGYTLSRTGTFMILSGALASVGGIGSPTLQSALTKHVPADKTGQLLGASGLLHALARVVAPTIFNGIYSVTVGKFTQTVFVCLTSTFGVAFLISWFVKPHIYVDEKHPTEPECEAEQSVGRL